MAPILLGEYGARARKNFSGVLKRLANVGQSHLAEVLHVAASTVSRWKTDGDLEQFCAVLAVLGLKCVSVQFKCYDPKELEPYFELARRHMAQMKSVEQLSFEDTDMHLEQVG